MQKARGHGTRPLPPLVGTRFQVLFHSPSGVLFTFPSRYWSAIGHQGVLSLGGWSPQIRTAFHGCGPTQERAREAIRFRLRDCYPLWCLCSTGLRLAVGFVTHAEPCRARKARPTTPTRQRLHACTCQVWADPLSLATTQGVSVDFLSSGYLDVSVPPLASTWLCIHHVVTPHYRRWVSPFGNPRVKGCSTPNRGFSQSSTPFIDSWCLGIHRVPLLS